MFGNDDNSTQERLKQYLLQGVEEQKKSSQEQKKKKELSSIEEKTNQKIAKRKKKQYETLFYETYADKVANLKCEEWIAENKIRKDPDKKDEQELVDILIQNERDDLQEKIGKLRKEIELDILEYITFCMMELKPDYQGTEDDVWNTILTKGENKFQDLQKKTMKLAEELAKAKLKAYKMQNIQWNVKFDNEKVMQKIAEIPLTIEDKIQEIKDTLDGLLGRKLDKFTNPESNDFDLDVLLAKMKMFIDPLLTAISPLEAVAGKIPIIGDLAGIMSLMSSGSKEGLQLTKEEIRKLIPNKPLLPANLKDVIGGIFDDIMMVSMQLPMICINVIFQMLNCIIGMFGQICGIIGVPGIPYPLSMVPACITAVPKIYDFINNVPVMMYAALKGLLIDKLTEAMALSVPKPNIDMDTLESLIPEIEDPEGSSPTQKSKPDTKSIDYKDVISDKLKEVKDVGYDRTDLQRVLKSYKEIYDGSKRKINEYYGFSGSSDNGSLQPIKGEIVQEKGTPEDFKAKLDAVFSGDLSAGVSYKKIMKTASVVGASYSTYKKQIEEKEPNTKVVLTDKITP